jgi:hypothetical protein
MKKRKGTWSWLAALVVAPLCTVVAACSGKTASPNGGACDSGTGTCGTGSQVFPFSGPSCTTASFADACWQCVDAQCGDADCVTTACGGFFTCFCACAVGDATCENGCSGQLTSACQGCAQSITACQQKACSAQCGTGSMTTTCTPQGTCGNGEELQACSSTYGGLCKAQYYQVGGQVFTCSSCGDCAQASAAAGAVCN